VNFATWLLGPLVGPECHRALARGWLILARSLAAMAVLAPTLVVLWTWWLLHYADAIFAPHHLFHTGLQIVEWMLISVALILSPAVLAGSLAGEKERGALGLLLTTRVSSYEIVCGRLVGKLAQVGMILLGGVPPLILFATWSGVRESTMLALLALVVSVAFGGAGLATAVSAMSRRGRDALLTVYLIELIIILMPMMSSLTNVPRLFEALSFLSPYSGLESLFEGEGLTIALLSIGFWSALGIIGTALASWRLLPASLRELDGPRQGRRSSRRGRVPALGEDRPMVWKELYVERGGSLGGAGRWLLAILTLLLAGGSLLLAAIMAWEFAFRRGDLTFEWAQGILETTVGQSGHVICWLIACAIGLRAAVTIASERERGTWDAILTSPLESREILNAKLWGSLYALRWLIAAAFLAWTIAVASEAITWLQYLDWGLSVLVGGTFMGVAGLRASLATATATKAMAVTMGIWLLAQIGLSIAAAIALGFVAITLIFTASLISDLPVAQVTSLYLDALPVSWVIARHAAFGFATFVLLGYTRVLFDRLAGRGAGGRVAVIVERMLQGDPSKPVAVAAPESQGEETQKTHPIPTEVTTTSR